MWSAERLTRSLRGRWFGEYGLAPCPKCQAERRPEQHALSIREGENGRLLLYCFKTGCRFESIAAAAGQNPDGFASGTPTSTARRVDIGQAEAEKRARQARALWDGAEPIRGTRAEIYLRGRAIRCALPSTLRHHPEAWHGPTARRLPALVALVDGGHGFAVHRTFLSPDGTGKADVPKGTGKMMLGACAGGAVRLAETAGPLVVAEGIETALSLASGLLRAPATIWAALSASSMAGLRLPPMPGRLILATDGDDAGRAAGHKLAERASALGWIVTLLPAPEGRDWNDVVRETSVTA